MCAARNAGVLHHSQPHSHLSDSRVKSHSSPPSRSESHAPCRVPKASSTLALHQVWEQLPWSKPGGCHKGHTASVQPCLAHIQDAQPTIYPTAITTAHSPLTSLPLPLSRGHRWLLCSFGCCRCCSGQARAALGCLQLRHLLYG